MNGHIFIVFMAILKPPKDAKFHFQNGVVFEQRKVEMDGQKSQNKPQHTVLKSGHDCNNFPTAPCSDKEKSNKQKTIGSLQSCCCLFLVVVFFLSVLGIL